MSKFSSRLKKNIPSEIKKKEKKANNITISELTESTRGTAKDKIEEEKNLLTELFAVVEIDYSDVKRFRRVTIKQANMDRPSLLKVELNDKEPKAHDQNSSKILLFFHARS